MNYQRIKIRMYQRRNTKAIYNFDYTMFIDINLHEDKKIKTLAHTHINSYEALDKKIVEDFIINNYEEHGLIVVDILYSLVSDYLLEKDKNNFNLVVKNNEELKTILKGV